MNLDPVRRIANAVLFEGYLLYPYRPSALKNRHRWQFGELWAGEHTQAECVFEGDQSSVTVVVRFLRDGVAHEIPVAVPRLPHEHEFDGGAVTVSAEPLVRGSRLLVRVESRGARFATCHTILGLSDGGFVSMVDPPDWAAEAVAACVNVGTWPVLAGAPGQRDLMLCAPIILYDHPQVAPESPGDTFDGTEIDELLALRTLTLSDAEKAEARAADPRAAALIDRAESLDPGQWQRMHGAIRHLIPAPGTRVRLRPGARRTDAQDMFLAGRLAVVEAVLRDVDDAPYLAVTLVDDPAADLCRATGRYRYFAPDEVEACDG